MAAQILQIKKSYVDWYSKVGESNLVEKKEIEDDKTLGIV